MKKRIHDTENIDDNRYDNYKDYYENDDFYSDEYGDDDKEYIDSKGLYAKDHNANADEEDDADLVDDDIYDSDEQDDDTDELSEDNVVDDAAFEKETNKTIRKCFKDYNFKVIMEDYHSGNPSKEEYAKECAIYALEGVVRGIIKKYYSSYARAHFEDLDQSGKMGIIKAMERYDVDKGAASTFFYNYILHEMQAYIDTFVNRTTPHYSANIRKIKKASAVLSKKKKNFTLVDLAQETGLTMEAIEQAMSILSYSDEVHFDNCTDKFMKENAKDSLKTPSPEDAYLESEAQKAIIDALNELSDLEKTVVVLSVGYSEKGMSHKEISSRINVPVDKIKKAYAEGIRKLRHSKLKELFSDNLAANEKILKQNLPIPILDISQVIIDMDDLAETIDINF